MKLAMSSTTTLRSFATGLIALAASAGLAAQTAAAVEEETQEWRTRGSDPSEIISRLEVRNEYIDLDGEGYINSTVLRGDWAPSESWQLRLDLPLNASDIEGPGSDYGLGDIYVSARGRWEPIEKWSLIGELGFKFDTATDHRLGIGGHQIAPLVGVVWKPNSDWIIAPFAYQYFGSFDVDHEREDISESNFAPKVLYHLPMGFWALVDAQVLINHDEDDEVAFYPEAEVGWVVAAHIEIWLRGGGRVAGSGSAERSGWLGEAGIRYLFD